LPIHYESSTWPTAPGGRPELLERYTYTDIQINPGLAAETFSPDNPDYDYPTR
jgi:outer membrane lipoprotein-sorting protein